MFSHRGALSLLVLVFFSTSCVYEFVLGSRKNYGRYESLYIERSLNPSGSLLGGDLLEDEIQKRFIENFPDIQLSGKNSSHLYMRLTVKSLAPNLKSVETAAQSEDLSLSPNAYKDDSGSVKAPHKLSKLTSARHGLLKGVLNCEVLVDVWDLKQRHRLFKKSYRSSESYRSLYHHDLRGLELDVKERSLLKIVSDEIATRLMGDLARVL